jgi:capsular polysaccharide transport system permease protein
MVSTYVESMSGIVTVEARAFRPDDAVLLVRTIGQLSEKLVNDISTRRARTRSGAQPRRCTARRG